MFGRRRRETAPVVAVCEVLSMRSAYAGLPTEFVVRPEGGTACLYLANDDELTALLTGLVSADHRVVVSADLLLPVWEIERLGEVAE